MLHFPFIWVYVYKNPWKFLIQNLPDFLQRTIVIIMTPNKIRQKRHNNIV